MDIEGLRRDDNVNTADFLRVLKQVIDHDLKLSVGFASFQQRHPVYLRASKP
jgi:hypothetical protein